MKIVGITGGIATGKSTVARLFGQRGALVRSADVDARAVLQPGTPATRAVLAAFPDVRIEGEAIDRARLAARIFGDVAARHQLEAITHPEILRRMRAVIADARSASGGVLAYETPLLYEAGLEGLFDRVVCTIANSALQATRLQERERTAGRPPLSNPEIAARLAAQLPNEEKARRADYVVRTDGALAETEAQVRRIFAEMSAIHSSQA